MSEIAPLPDIEALGAILLDAGLALLAIILVVRAVGLRSFAKMSSFDFAVTVATGSILGSVVLDASISFVHALVAVGALLLAQVVVSLARLRFERVHSVFDNTPLLLMDGADILEDNLRYGRVARVDLIAKLREANVMRLADVQAVVLETTGDISVLHGSQDELEPVLLDGVRRSVDR